jgi:Ca2+-transporting ATPase
LPDFSTSVICSDKTGTLTKDEMTVRKIFAAGQLLDVSGVGYAPEGQFSRDGVPEEPAEPLRRLLQGAALACDARIVRHETDGRWDVKGDPTEGALVVAAEAGLDKGQLEARFPRVAEVPFTCEAKRMTTLHDGPEGGVAYSKGAPEVILDSCVRRMTADGEAALGSAVRDEILVRARDMAGEALRVLAIAAPRAGDFQQAEDASQYVPDWSRRRGSDITAGYCSRCDRGACRRPPRVGDGLFLFPWSFWTILTKKARTSVGGGQLLPTA